MNQRNKITIVFLSPYPFDTAPGPRFRYEQYLGILKDKGYDVVILSFLDKSTFRILYKKGYFLRKLIGILLGFLNRIIHMIIIIPSDYVFIYREASPIGFPVFEWIIAKLLRKKIIYDFDDAIWLKATSSENLIIEKLKFQKKVGMICKWAFKISAGNSYLCNYAKTFNSNSFVIPTTIDTGYHNKMKNQKTELVVIGWTGTHSTLIYLDLVYSVLKKLDSKYDFIFEVIADKEVKYDLKNFVYKKWNKDTEIDDLLNFNIGIMPLTNDEWAKGKCGFKALQYMALGIPPVVSAVGVNSKIVTEKLDGFVCTTEDEWYQQLSILIEDTALRIKMGKSAVEKVNNNYSVLSNVPNFLALFN